MKIYSMTATFGKLEHQTLTLQPGLNIIHAPNEWGKSTWCAFLVAMLYGIETRLHSTKSALADKERYAPWSGAPMSGSMDICWNGRDITIERSSKGRSIFGVFRAYETHTGLEVPELTAANCGEMLLGVEKTVFTRAGFLKLTDLPVTEDKALWRRLNALVTTGDESGTSDILAQKLRDLKNRCRANRANGLIPEALYEKEVLEGKLEQFRQLREQQQKFRQRQEEMTGFAQRLKHHKQVAEYEAAKDQLRRADAARLRLEEITAQADALEKECAALSSPEQLHRDLAQLQDLRQRREALQMEAQLLPALPMQPQPPAPFYGCTPEQAIQQAKEDTKKYDALAEDMPKPSAALFILGFCLTGTGLVSLALLRPIAIAIGILAVGVALALVGLLRFNKVKNQRLQQQNQRQLLRERYRPHAPGTWEALAQTYGAEDAAYRAAQTAHAAQQTRIREGLEEVNAQMQTLTQGRSWMEQEALWRAALETHSAYADTLRQQKQAEEVAEALGQTQVTEPPVGEDTLTFSLEETNRLISDAEFELRQLLGRMGRCQGQMETLGREEDLQQKLDEVNDRLRKLQDTYAALELAQKYQEAASAELQRRFAPRISRRAQEIFGRLTGGRYEKLTMAADLSLMVSAENENTLRSSLWRSDGTADQLYLALRLAVAEALTPNAPLVLDDALVRFDDTRLKEAMAVLQEAAEEKQVILFTCQEREQNIL